jgi:hypothetical protein
LLCDAHQERFRVRGQIRPLSIETFVGLARAERELAASAYVLRPVTDTPRLELQYLLQHEADASRPLSPRRFNDLVAVVARDNVDSESAPATAPPASDKIAELSAAGQSDPLSSLGSTGWLRRLPSLRNARLTLPFEITSYATVPLTRREPCGDKAGHQPGAAPAGGARSRRQAGHPRNRH